MTVLPLYERKGRPEPCPAGDMFAGRVRAVVRRPRDFQRGPILSRSYPVH